MTRAIVVRDRATCALENVELRPLGDRDVLVRLSAGGVCHSDVSVVTGDLPVALPLVLGHEGAGTVEHVGRDVTRARAGDRVVLSAIPSCGWCHFCTRGQPVLCERSSSIRAPGFLDRGQPLAGLSGLGAFSDYVVVSELAVVALQTDLPHEQLAVLGCAVLTGAGAVLNAANVDAGDSVLVIGCGGIGLAAIQAARLAGAHPIIAVDITQSGRVGALACGATVACPPGEELEEAVRSATGGRGVECAVEAVGSERALRSAWELTRRGGAVVAVGLAAPDVQIPIAAAELPMSNRRLVGCTYGDSVVDRDIARYGALAEAGRLDLGALCARTVDFVDLPHLLGDHTELGGGRTIVRMA